MYPRAYNDIGISEGGDTSSGTLDQNGISTDYGHWLFPRYSSNVLIRRAASSREEVCHVTRIMEWLLRILLPSVFTGGWLAVGHGYVRLRTVRSLPRKRAGVYEPNKYYLERNLVYTSAREDSRDRNGR